MGDLVLWKIAPLREGILSQVHTYITLSSMKCMMPWSATNFDAFYQTALRLHSECMCASRNPRPHSSHFLKTKLGSIHVEQCKIIKCHSNLWTNEYSSKNNRNLKMCTEGYHWSDWNRQKWKCASRVLTKVHSWTPLFGMSFLGDWTVMCNPAENSEFIMIMCIRAEKCQDMEMWNQRIYTLVHFDACCA